ncbi:MAG TPA: hypothetical protein PKL83_07380, partial [bacterium]|nr:hypothetical protein [bacterium]
QITYALVENNVLKLLTTSVDGTGEVLLMTAKVFDENPVVQLTDRQDMILYTESTLSGGTGAKTFISNIDGTERREVVSSDLALPKDLGQLWSPDGRFILYSFENNLWLYRLESGETTLVTDALTRKDAAASLPLYAWHPKQDSLLYVKDTATVVLYQIDSREGAELLDLGDQTIVQIYWPYANYIYAICAVPGGDRVIQKITIASKSAEPVAENTLPEQALVFDQESFDFVFSVDGIADASRHAEEGLWLYDAETQRLLQLVSESASVLIPVGYAREWSGQVYFKRVDGSTVTLGAVDLESGDMTRLKYGRGLYLFE